MEFCCAALEQAVTEHGADNEGYGLVYCPRCGLELKNLEYRYTR